MPSIRRKGLELRPGRVPQSGIQSRRHKEGYFPVPPTDSLNDLRNEMVMELQKVGIRIEAQHHEVATAGQAEIDMRFDGLVKMADKLQWFKYILKNVACATARP